MANELRVATYSTELKRKGPGLLLRDILKGSDPQISAVVAVIAQVDPDILLLTGFDYDYQSLALLAFADQLRASGVDYPHVFALAPNRGMASNLDLDGDGWFGSAKDAQGFGEFAGQGGMALLSRFPVAVENVRDFSHLLWAGLPNAILPTENGEPFPSSQVLAVQRLSSTGHWDVPVDLPGGTQIRLLGFHAGTPAFDGPQGRNARRNHDEVSFWRYYLDGELAADPPKANFVILGDANLDANDGLGMQEAIATLTRHPKIQDPQPVSEGGIEASQLQGGVNLAQTGDPAMDTADWRDVDGPGNLRVDYVLPSADLQVLDAGVFWPASDDPMHQILYADGIPASRHALVWVDIGW